MYAIIYLQLDFLRGIEGNTYHPKNEMRKNYVSQSKFGPKFGFILYENIKQTCKMMNSD